MSFLALVPRWVWEILGVLAIAVGLFFVGDEHGRGIVQAKWDVQSAAYAQAARDDAAEKQRTVARWHDGVQGVQDAQTKQIAVAVADAAGAHTELGRLRDRLAAVQAEPPAAASSAPDRVDEAPALARLLSQCSGQLQSVSAVADDLSVQVTGLQGFILATKDD